MGIPIGKLSLYAVLGGIDPARTLPVLLDAGTDNAGLLDDPMYLGWRHHRIAGAAYDNFVDRFVRAIRAELPGVLLQWEDFATPHALPILERYRGCPGAARTEVAAPAGAAASRFPGTARHRPARTEGQAPATAAAAAAASTPRAPARRRPATTWGPPGAPGTPRPAGEYQARREHGPAGKPPGAAAAQPGAPGRTAGPPAATGTTAGPSLPATVPRERRIRSLTSRMTPLTARKTAASSGLANTFVNSCCSATPTMPTGIVARMIIQASRSSGVVIDRVRSDVKNPRTIRSQSRQKTRSSRSPSPRAAPR